MECFQLWSLHLLSYLPQISSESHLGHLPRILIEMNANFYISLWFSFYLQVFAISIGSVSGSTEHASAAFGLGGSALGTGGIVGIVLGCSEYKFL
jgi:hypothetical protein